MNKIYYTNGNLLRGGFGYYLADKQDHHFDTKVEVRIIEPVYEYQVIFENGGRYALSLNFYENKNEFNLKSGYVFTELYQPSKRERV